MECTSINILYLLLGSNLGDRQAVLSQASEEIVRAVGTIQKSSSLYETAPWGVTNQPAFLNQVLEVRTTLSPDAVLHSVLEIEQALGRVRFERWGARVIDIDILFFNDLVCHEARLTIPHPRLHERRFTLVPLAEIAPVLVHPLLGKTIQILLDETSDITEVTLFSLNSTI
ncbi:2-amino-4-hydroxy-6-hydroxymethyldihydropteridine diphosphokinase [Dyadobacter tibetensis]|uniref:2-amino-4-hydroxy-6- hydroxymethyldihydropteridine diphosphokinase n=1 Tax=Dyadobacter tibetensis TaxID=1211851 RepID=UPI00046EF7EF|nr:2-amino-4-hydroxy-6-hydroxymethyldihydropteridine diphosphokinase [Dyadobacter tibetensis]